MHAENVSTNLHVQIFFTSLFWVFSSIVQAIISDHSKNNYSHYNNPFHMSMSLLSPQLKVKTTPAYQLMITWSDLLERDRSNILVELTSIKHPYSPQFLTERNRIYSMEKGIHLYWLDLPSHHAHCVTSVHLFHISNSQLCCSLSALPLNYSGC